MDRSRPGLLLAVLVFAAAAACGGSDDEPSTTTESSTTTEPSTTTTEEATTTTEPAGEAQVDLDFTGTYVLNIHEQAGACTVVDGMLSFSMTGEDVDGIGEELSVEQTDATEGALEWAIDDLNAYASSDGATLTFSQDGTSVEIDDDLEQLEQKDTPRPVHVTGTITCS